MVYIWLLSGVGIMRLSAPTEFDILKKLEDGRNVPGNLAVELDKSRGYVRSQLPKLADYGLVEKIGPLENSGLYELTEKGRLAYQNRERYQQSPQEFEGWLDAQLDE